MTKTREFHDLANIFPMLAGDEAKALANDIFEHGLREPITLLEGKILDGRNRYIACLDAGVEPRFAPYKGDNPAAYMVSLNLKRRHLDESQRAMVAKKLATLEHGQRQTGKFAGVTTQAKAASMLNVSERSVRTAGSVIDKAVPEIVTAVEKGDVSISAAAQFAKQPKEEQASRSPNRRRRPVPLRRFAIVAKSGRPNRGAMTARGAFIRMILRRSHT
jgi:ParB-like chromosome segregation protein Spo0J